MDCSKSLLAKYCDGKDVKRVTHRSRTAGPKGTNEYQGPVVAMCAGCRKANCGLFKITPKE